MHGAIWVYEEDGISTYYEFDSQDLLCCFNKKLEKESKNKR